MNTKEEKIKQGVNTAPSIDMHHLDYVIPHLYGSGEDSGEKYQHALVKYPFLRKK